MNPSEAITGMVTLYELASVYLTLYISVLSGYLFVAYTVGNKLKPMQAHFVSLLFILFGFLMIWGSFALNQAGASFQFAYVSPGQERGPGFNQYLILAIEVLSMIGALAFMRDIRKSKTGK